jgi:uracil-DNA glycosylase
MVQQQLNDVVGKGWGELLYDRLNMSVMRELSTLLQQERLTKTIHPASEDVFNAFKYTHYEDVKICIIGQDPYINGEAHGLAFSCKEGFKKPPSLRVILDAVSSEDKFTDLTRWSKQGVFLLNTILTVEKGLSLSHAGRGWEDFTSFVISKLNNHPNKLVFMLWGANARRLAKYIDRTKHLVLEDMHPAATLYDPSKKFNENKMFNQANKYLIEQGYEAVNW